MKRTFKAGYRRLPPSVRKELKQRIITEIFKVNNSQTFYDKKNGRDVLYDLEWKEIKKAFAEFGIDAQTGESLEIQKQ